VTVARLSDSYSILQLAKMALVDEGATAEGAADALLAGGVDSDALAEKARAKLDARQAQLEREVREASPEGRRAAAEAAEASARERARDLELSRTLLREQGDPLADDYLDEDALHLSGISPRVVEERRSGSLGDEARALRDARWGSDRAAERAYAERGRSDA
jgi:hypothetical protein